MTEQYRKGDALPNDLFSVRSQGQNFKAGTARFACDVTLERDGDAVTITATEPADYIVLLDGWHRCAFTPLYDMRLIAADGQEVGRWAA